MQIYICNLCPFIDKSIIYFNVFIQKSHIFIYDSYKTNFTISETLLQHPPRPCNKLFDGQLRKIPLIDKDVLPAH